MLKKFKASYYDGIYKYSNRKLSALFSDNVLKYLFETFVDSGELHSLLETDQTMGRNKDMYTEAIEAFRESFRVGRYTKMVETAKKKLL